MNKTRQAVETVNFRLHFKVIIRQNETQYFTYSKYTERKHSITGGERLSKTVKLYLHDGITLYILHDGITLYIQALTQLVGRQRR